MVRLHKEHDGEGHDAHGVRDKVVTRLLVFKKLHNAHLHLLGDVLAQEAGRLDEQDDDQNTKDDGVGKARGNVSLRHRLDDADENATDKGTRDGADAAEDGGVEGLDARHGTRRGLQHRRVGAQEHAGDGGKRRADGKR